MLARDRNAFVVTATADAATTTATATQVGTVGQRLYATGFDLTYTTATTGSKQVTLTYTPETTGVETTLTFFENMTTSDGRFRFPGPLPCQQNTPISLTAPSGGAAAIGTLTSDGTVPTAGDTITVGAVVYTYRATVTTIANEIKIGTGGSAVADTMTNTKNAINAGTGAGTTYGSLTVANPTVTATASGATTVTLAARTQGTAGNSLATTETSSHLSFGGLTLSGGAATTTDVHLWLYRD